MTATLHEDQYNYLDRGRFAPMAVIQVGKWRQRVTCVIHCLCNGTALPALTNNSFNLIVAPCIS